MKVEFPAGFPLQANKHGVVRFRGTRVTLDSVVYAFNGGATPEEIVLRFPTLRLADVYTVAGHYLQHRHDIDAYLKERGDLSDQARQEAERRLPSSELRQMLLARFAKSA